ncbi:MAG: glycosyltransferase family 4 protein [Eubacteriales bacterium]
MKILVITQYFYPEQFRVNTLCEELVHRGHDVTVLTGYPQYPKGKIYEGYGFNTPYENNWNGVKIHRVNMRPRGKTPLGLLMNCFTFVREGNKWVEQCEEKYDAIYVFEVSPVTVGLPALTYKKKFGTPIFFNVQDLWPENVEVIMGIHNRLIIDRINKTVDKIYNGSDKILCSSRGFVENIAARGIARDKLVFWPQFCDQPDSTQLHRPKQFEETMFNVVFTGNIGQAQGIDLLVKAINLIKKENVKCYLVGDGRAIDGIKKLVAELEIEHKVEFVGRVSEHEANEYVHYADAAYLSLVDNKVFNMTIPAKLQTYLACGTPIIGAVDGECASIIEQNQCGICAKRTPEDVAASILKIKKQTPEDIITMRECASQCFCEHFTKEKLVTELEHLMKESI